MKPGLSLKGLRETEAVEEGDDADDGGEVENYGGEPQWVKTPPKGAGRELWARKRLRWKERKEEVAGERLERCMVHIPLERHFWRVFAAPSKEPSRRRPGGRRTATQTCSNSSSNTVKYAPGWNDETDHLLLFEGKQHEARQK